MARVAPLLMNETKNEEQGQREPGEIIDDEEEEDVAAAAIKPIPVEPHQELAMPAHPVEIRFDEKMAWADGTAMFARIRNVLGYHPRADGKEQLVLLATIWAYVSRNAAMGKIEYAKHTAKQRAKQGEGGVTEDKEEVAETTPFVVRIIFRPSDCTFWLPACDIFALQGVGAHKAFNSDPPTKELPSIFMFATHAFPGLSASTSTKYKEPNRKYLRVLLCPTALSGKKGRKRQLVGVPQTAFLDALIKLFANLHRIASSSTIRHPPAPSRNKIIRRRKSVSPAVSLSSTPSPTTTSDSHKRRRIAIEEEEHEHEFDPACPLPPPPAPAPPPSSSSSAGGESKRMRVVGSRMAYLLEELRTEHENEAAAAARNLQEVRRLMEQEREVVLMRSQIEKERMLQEKDGHEKQNLKDKLEEAQNKERYWMDESTAAKARADEEGRRLLVLQGKLDDAIKQTEHLDTLRRVNEHESSAISDKWTRLTAWVHHVLASKKVLPIDCAICLDPIKNPRTLPCGHIFCGDCIEEQGKAAAEMICALCHLPHPVNAAFRVYFNVANPIDNPDPSLLAYVP